FRRRLHSLAWGRRLKRTSSTLRAKTIDREGKEGIDRRPSVVRRSVGGVGRPGLQGVAPCPAICQSRLDCLIRRIEEGLTMKRRVALALLMLSAALLL